MLVVEDSDVADYSHNLAFCGLRDFRGYFFFGFFEFAEFYLNQFMIFQSEINLTDYLFVYAASADDDQRL